MKFGNKNHVAFEIMDMNQSNDLWDLNFYLGGKLISKEAVYISSYCNILQEFKRSLGKNQYESVTLEALSTNECFYKLMEERDVDENQFFNYLFRLDETLDQYVIFVFQSKLETCFIWTCWDQNNCNNYHELNELYSVKTLTSELISIISEFTSEIYKERSKKV